MPPENGLALPFLTRKMLTFDHEAFFELRIRSQADTAAVLTIRGLTRDGVFTFRHTTVAGGNTTTETFRIPDVPITVSVIDENQAYDQGECYAALSLSVNGGVVHALCSGLVFSQKAISFPQAESNPYMPDRGFIRTRTSADPAAGSELTITVPDGRIWNVLAVSFQLVAAAVAASRRVHVVFSASGGPTINVFSDIDQIINETRNYSVAHFGHVLDSLDDNDILIPLPDKMLLIPESTITTETTNLDGADNFGAMSVLVEEFWRFV